MSHDKYASNGNDSWALNHVGYTVKCQCRKPYKKIQIPRYTIQIYLTIFSKGIMFHPLKLHSLLYRAVAL